MIDVKSAMHVWRGAKMVNGLLQTSWAVESQHGPGLTFYSNLAMDDSMSQKYCQLNDLHDE